MTKFFSGLGFWVRGEICKITGHWYTTTASPLALHKEQEKKP